MSIEDRIGQIQANFDQLMVRHLEWLEKYKRLVEAHDAAMKVVCEVADAEVYHDAQGAMLIVESGDELIAKARAVLAREATEG